MNADTQRLVAAAAWGAFKQAEQPSFDAISGDYQTRLIGIVQSVERNGASDDPFEQLVKAEIEKLQAADVVSVVESEAVPESATADGAESETAETENAGANRSNRRRL